MSNLFSSFDANTSIFSLNWLSALGLQLCLVSGFWLSKFPLSALFCWLLNFLHSQFELNLLKIRSPGHSLWLVSCFIYIFLNNFLGLLPYVFTASSHLVFSLSFALLSWFTYYLVYLLKELSGFLAHLVPLGTPYPLMPLMVFIELISGLIRPLTLSVRLVANMVAGHLLMVLLSSPLAGVDWVSGVLGLTVLVLLLMLESGVSVIQGYVFSLLSSLYLAESNGSQLNYLYKIIWL